MTDPTDRLHALDLARADAERAYVEDVAPHMREISQRLDALARAGARATGDLMSGPSRDEWVDALEQLNAASDEALGAVATARGKRTRAINEAL